MADLATTQRLDRLSERLNEKLAELHRRATRVRRVVSPSTYWNDPGLQFAGGAAVGYFLGRRGSSGLIVVALAALVVLAARSGIDAPVKDGDDR